MVSLATQFLSSAGLLLAAGVTGHHLYHIRRHDSRALHGSLSRYYQVLLPYVAVSGIVAAVFFSIILFPAELAAIVGGRTFVDVGFLGATLVWLGAAQRIFSAVDQLAEDYFAAGDTGGS